MSVWKQYYDTCLICFAEFATDDRNVEVNEGDSQSSLTLTVERVGGAVGVVQVQWNLTTSNGMSYVILEESENQLSHFSL